MDRNSHIKSEKYFFPLVILLALISVGINYLPFKQSIINALDLGSQPIGEIAYTSSKGVSDFFGVFQEVKTLKTDYYNLLEEHLRLEADSGMISLLKEENLALKKQLDFKNVEDSYLKAEILTNASSSENETVLINQGSAEGVQEGDIAVVGNIYVGVVTEVNNHSSKIRLPMSRASFIKVIIAKPEATDLLDTKILNGVAVGYSNVIRIENIETTGDLEEGYSVIIKDPKIPKMLLLGKVFAIEDDPTASSRSVEVLPPIDYQYLKYVYILLSPK